MNEPLISVVIPVHNQADHISRVVREYQSALMALHRPHELILVTNACRDHSLEVCRGLEAQDPTIRVIDSDQGGWGRAVRLGLRAARGDLLCYTNSARTSAPDLARLLRAGAEKGAVIKANRAAWDNWRRRIGSWLYNLECRVLFRLSCQDVNGTPKVFPRTCAKLLELTRDDDLIDAEFNIICRREGYPVQELPVSSQRRHGGASTTRMGSALKMYWRVWKLWRTLREAGR